MATINISGLEELSKGMAQLARIPADVKKKIIRAGADVVVKEQKKQAQNMLRGEYYKGDVAAGVKAKEPVLNADGVSQVITFQGTVRDEKHKSGTRVAEIAFINEYGKKGQPARPFVRTANALAEREAAEAEQKEFDKFIKSNDF